MTLTNVTIKASGLGGWNLELNDSANCIITISNNTWSDGQVLINSDGGDHSISTLTTTNMSITLQGCSSDSISQVYSKNTRWILDGGPASCYVANFTNSTFIFDSNYFDESNYFKIPDPISLYFAGDSKIQVKGSLPLLTWGSPAASGGLLSLTNTEVILSDGLFFAPGKPPATIVLVKTQFRVDGNREAYQALISVVGCEVRMENTEWYWPGQCVYTTSVMYIIGALETSIQSQFRAEAFDITDWGTLQLTDVRQNCSWESVPLLMRNAPGSTAITKSIYVTPSDYTGLYDDLLYIAVNCTMVDQTGYYLIPAAQSEGIKLDTSDSGGRVVLPPITFQAANDTFTDFPIVISYQALGTELNLDNGPNLFVDMVLGESPVTCPARLDYTGTVTLSNNTSPGSFISNFESPWFTCSGSSSPTTVFSATCAGWREDKGDYTNQKLIIVTSTTPSIPATTQSINAETLMLGTDSLMVSRPVDAEYDWPTFAVSKWCYTSTFVKVKYDHPTNGEAIIIGDCASLLTADQPIITDDGQCPYMVTSLPRVNQTQYLTHARAVYFWSNIIITIANQATLYVMDGYSDSSGINRNIYLHLDGLYSRASDSQDILCTNAKWTAVAVVTPAIGTFGIGPNCSTTGQAWNRKTNMWCLNVSFTCPSDENHYESVSLIDGTQSSPQFTHDIQVAGNAYVRMKHPFIAVTSDLMFDPSPDPIHWRFELPENWNETSTWNWRITTIGMTGESSLGGAKHDIVMFQRRPELYCLEAELSHFSAAATGCPILNLTSTWDTSTHTFPSNPVYLPPQSTVLAATNGSLQYAGYLFVDSGVKLLIPVPANFTGTMQLNQPGSPPIVGNFTSFKAAYPLQSTQRQSTTKNCGIVQLKDLQTLTIFIGGCLVIQSGGVNATVTNVTLTGNVEFTPNSTTTVSTTTQITIQGCATFSGNLTIQVPHLEDVVANNQTFINYNCYDGGQFDSITLEDPDTLTTCSTEGSYSDSAFAALVKSCHDALVEPPPNYTGAIIGGVIGGVVLLALIAVLLICFVKPIHRRVFPNRNRLERDEEMMQDKHDKKANRKTMGPDSVPNHVYDNQGRSGDNVLYED